MIRFLKIAFAGTCLVACGRPLLAQAVPTVALEETGIKRADRFLADNRETYLRNADIAHHWIGQSDVFWYMRSDLDGARRFVIVDARDGSMKPAFDQVAIASSLSAASDRRFTAGDLPFTSFEFKDGQEAIRFLALGKQWDCSVATASCTASAIADPNQSVSPDGRWIAFARDDNLWLKSVATGRETALTTDGIPHDGYAGQSGDTMSAVSSIRNHDPRPPQIVWSPDSRQILTQRLDERKVGELHLLDPLPADGSLRPKLYSFRVPLPGDKDIVTAKLMIFDVASGHRVDIDSTPLIAEYINPVAGGQTWWSEDGRHVYYLQRDRFYRVWTLNVADPGTGKSRELIRETGPTNVTINWFREKPMVRTLRDGSIIWFSERSGWGHLYRYAPDGTLLNSVTSGPWLVRQIFSVDENKHKIYFGALGKEPGAQPYDEHIYSVDYDGGDLTLLTPEDADHNQTDLRNMSFDWRGSASPLESASERDAFSADNHYFVDSYSTPTMPPRLVVRREDGKLVKLLETADNSRMKQDGLPQPEPFKVLAADGKTAVYGTMFKPSNFDPNKKYPVVEAVYPGPQTIMNSRFYSAMFTAPGGAYDRQALAELGFIVVTLDGRGNVFRSKANWNESYGKMGNAGMLEDHIAGLRQLGSTRPYLDLGRVGIYGISGGGYQSTHALLQYPDFYKVAVSTSGSHDERLYQAWWGDLYNGPNLGAYTDMVNATLAPNLKGKLFLIYGDMDDNVNPANTIRVVNALIAARKDFDLLAIPGGNHGLAVPDPVKSGEVSSYVRSRRWKYLMQNLLGVDVPLQALDPAPNPIH